MGGWLNGVGYHGLSTFMSSMLVNVSGLRAISLNRYRLGVVGHTLPAPLQIQPTHLKFTVEIK